MQDKRRFSLVLAVLAVCFVPHAFRLPMEIVVAVGGAWAYALGMQHRGWPVPPRWLRVLLTFGCLGVVIALSDRSFGRDDGVVLLALMLGMKPLESKSLRDLLALLFLAYFVVITNVLYSQTLGMSAYMMCSATMITGMLAHMHSGRATVLPDMRLGAELLFQALPLAVLLFVFFPRLPGALWGVHDARDEASTGFSETVEPGSVAGLSLSREVVFRVDFPQGIPSRNDLYWRGAVLDSFDGRTWSRSTDFQRLDTRPEVPSSRRIAYTLTLEPHNSRWLFALDLPVEAPRGAVLGEEFTLETLRLTKTRRRFELVSASFSPSDGTPPGPRWTALPESGNERARALAASWRAAGHDAQTMVNLLSDMFRKGFAYTLRPGPSTGEIIDHFLYTSRQGYCEHFASATAFLLRAAGIPARVVSGYQGGELNPVGGYLLVRQSEAHAWTEVWMEHKGWVRVDPTTVVAPLRIVQGVDAITPRGETILPEQGLNMLRAVRTYAHQGWDAMNNAWNQWVLDFGHDRQRGLWERLGLNGWSARGAWGLAGLLALGFILIFGVAAWRILRTRQPAEPVQAAYLHFSHMLARQGLAPKTGEGPLDHARRVHGLRPDLGPAVDAVVETYVALRYNEHGHARTLQKQVREFARHLRKKHGKQ